MKSARAIVALFLLAACTEQRAAEAPPTARQAAPPPETVVYACDGERSAEASYSADGAMALTLAGETWPMNPAEAVSGTRWIGEDLEWWVTLEDGQEVGTLRRLGAQRVGEAVVARCLRPTTGGVLAPEPPIPQEPDVTPATGEPCRAPALSLQVVSGDAAAGSRFTVLAFANEGSGVCRLQGYPDLTLIDADGEALTGFRINQQPGSYYAESRPIEAVSLEPGERAYFDLVTTAVAGEIPGETEPCAPIIAVRASPPGDEGSVQAPIELNPCNGRARVTPFRPVEEPNPAD